MSAVRFHGRGDVRLDRVPSPVPSPGTVHLDVAWCGVCGSDLHELRHGPLATPANAPHPLTGEHNPVVLGHEFSGTVQTVGAGVTELAPGDRVVVEPLLSDGDCDRCRAGSPNHCRRLGFIGLSGGGGGLSEQVAVPAANIHRLPDEVSLRTAALVEPFAVALRAVHLGGCPQGGRAVVLGAGPIGLAILLCLRAMDSDLEDVAVVEPDARRARFAERLGADRVSGAADELRGSSPRSSSRAHVVFETSGAEAALGAGMRLVAPGGAMVNLALWSTQPPVDINRLVAHEIRMLGSLGYVDEFPQVLSLLTAGKLDPEALVTDEVPLADACAALDRLATGPGAIGKLLVHCGADGGGP